MACRYQKLTDRESDVSFRVVVYFAVNNTRTRTEKSSRFLLVDNSQETIEAVQTAMQDFVKTAILANRLGKLDNSMDLSRDF